MGWKYTVATGVFSRQFVQSLKSEAQVQAARLRCLTPMNRLRRRSLRPRVDSRSTSAPGSTSATGGRPWTSWSARVAASDGTCGGPFEAGSVKRIHCEHFFEHLRFPTRSCPRWQNASACWSPAASSNHRARCGTLHPRVRSPRFRILRGHARAWRRGRAVRDRHRDRQPGVPHGRRSPSRGTSW